MKYDNQPILADWQNHDDEMKALTKHADMKTARKYTLTAILTSVNGGRLLGCKVRKDGKRKVVSAPRSATPLFPALVEALGENVTSIPELLNTYYTNIYHRPDYELALQIGLNNMKAIDKMTDTRHRQGPSSQRKLFQVSGRDDVNREDKHILADVARGISLALFNQVSGQQLTKQNGRGLYLTREGIRDCMKKPNAVNDEKLSNAILLMRVAGYIRLAQPEELTDEGKKLDETWTKDGRKINTHRVYVVNDFDEADWALVADNFRLKLNSRLGRTILKELLDEKTVSRLYPDLYGGVTEPVISFLMAKVNDSTGNQPIMSLVAAQDTIESISDVSQVTAAKYLDEALMIKSIRAAKLSYSQAKKQGYDLGNWKPKSPAEKIIFPTTEKALLDCVHHLNRKDKKAISTIKQLND